MYERARLGECCLDEECFDARDTRDTGRIAAAMLIQPESAVALSAASIRPHLIIRDSAQPPE